MWLAQVAFADEFGRIRRFHVLCLLMCDLFASGRQRRLLKSSRLLRRLGVEELGQVV